MSKDTFGNKLPRAVAQDLKLVGEQIRLARLRRNLSMEQIAERATCSVPSVAAVENGKSTVSIGIYIRILYALGLNKDILHIAADDPLGRDLQDLKLPRRRRATKTNVSNSN
jgi:transcriptional regulator with XRE-family HTH domain